MNIKQLEAFRTIMMTGSVTNAARMLNISQPGVSRLLGELEQSIGFKLFFRRKGRLQPSTEGVNFFEELERSFVGIERLKTVAQEIKELRRGHLRIAAMPALCLELIPTSIKRFLQQHPNLKITFEAHSSPRIIEWVAARHFDIGFAQLTLDQQGVEIKNSFRTRCVCVLPKNHFLDGKKYISVKDLEGEPFIALAQHTLAALQIDQTFVKANVRRNIRVETQTSFTACSLVAQGLGVALIDPLTATFFDKKNIIIKPFRPSIPFDFRIIIPTQNIPSRVIDLFVSEINKFLTHHELVSLI